MCAVGMHEALLVTELKFSPEVPVGNLIEPRNSASHRVMVGDDVLVQSALLCSFPLILLL